MSLRGELELDSTTAASLNTPAARSRSSGWREDGGGGGHEQYTSSAPGLHGGRLPVTDTGIYAPLESH